jgi:TatA/E family protein of Tat protein translocase
MRQSCLVEHGGGLPVPIDPNPHALPPLQLLRYDDLMSFADTLVLFVLALLLFGPKKLPVIARQIGKALNEFRRASNEFKAQIESEINQLEYQERQKKEREEVQKILPPTQPPAESVQSARSSSPSEVLASADNGNSSIELNSVASNEPRSSADSHERNSAVAPDITNPESHEVNSTTASNIADV